MSETENTCTKLIQGINQTESKLDATQRKLAIQFLFRARQEGYTFVENPPRHIDTLVDVDIFKGKTKICAFNDRQLGDWKLQVRAEDGMREDTKLDFYKLHDMFIGLRELYMVYHKAEPLQGYDRTEGNRAIMRHGGCVLAVRSCHYMGELAFCTFLEVKNSDGKKTIFNEAYFEMDRYADAKRSFVIRSGLIPQEQLITPENINYLHGSCQKVLRREGSFMDENTTSELTQVITDLDKAQDLFRETYLKTQMINANIPQYIGAEILGNKCAFTKYEINSCTIPKGLHSYNVHYSSKTMKINAVSKNFKGDSFGTVITKRPLPIGEKGYAELGENDFLLNPNKRHRLSEFQAKNKDYVR